MRADTGSARRAARWLLDPLSHRARAAESEDRFRTMFDASPVAISLSDEQGHMIAVNPALCRLFGRPGHELLGSSSEPFTHPDDRHFNHEAESLLDDARETGDGVVRLEKRYLRPDGCVVWAALTVTTTSGPNGERWTLCHLEDVTARRTADEALRASQAQLASMARVVRRLQTGADPRQTIVEAAGEVAGATSAALFEPDDGSLVITASTNAAIVGHRLPLAVRSANGHAYRTRTPLLVTDPASDPLVDPGLLAQTASGSILCHPVIVQDRVVAVLCASWPGRVEARAEQAVRAVELLADEAGVALEHDRMVRELELSATTDSLTGLANRRGWDEGVPRLLASARRTGSPLTVAVVDLDRFKQYNDTRGHLAGDDLLREFAGRVRAVLRDVDLVARWGGEEFAIALPECGSGVAHQLLERVRAEVPQGETCSVGHASWDGSEDAAHLVSRADTALYAAKRAGRDAVRASEPGTCG